MQHRHELYAARMREANSGGKPIKADRPRKQASEQDFSELNQAIEARGYLVMASWGKRAIGEIIPDVLFKGPQHTNQPVRVIAETDRADHQAQCELWGRDSHASLRRNFYRVVTD